MRPRPPRCRSSTRRRSPPRWCLFPQPRSVFWLREAWPPTTASRPRRFAAGHEPMSWSSGAGTRASGRRGPARTGAGDRCRPPRARRVRLGRQRAERRLHRSVVGQRRLARGPVRGRGGAGGVPCVGTERGGHRRSRWRPRGWTPGTALRRTCWWRRRRRSGTGRRGRRAYEPARSLPRAVGGRGARGLRLAGAARGRGRWMGPPSSPLGWPGALAGSSGARRPDPRAPRRPGCGPRPGSR